MVRKSVKYKKYNSRTMLNLNDFKASDRWLTKFKQRHTIVFKGICGEAGLISPSYIDSWNKHLIGTLNFKIKFFSMSLTNICKYLKK